MISLYEMQIVKDLPNKKLGIKRNFQLPPEMVWIAWTESEFLDQWWAPKPWRAETRAMDFRQGGFWLYAMVGPGNERQWKILNYLKIQPKESFISEDTFCDEYGVPNDELPYMHWYTRFIPEGSGTTVQIEITFKQEADLHKYIEMGFEEGFTAALDFLHEMFEMEIYT